MIQQMYFPGKIQQYEDIDEQIFAHIQEENNQPQNVTYLSLKNHKIHHIKNLFQLKNLKVIDLRNNLLTQMIGFQNCQNLHELHLCENNIRSIKRIDMLKNLEMIDLRGNRIYQLQRTSLNSNLPRCLKKLMIRCNYITQITQLIKSESQLDILWADQNLLLNNYCQLLKLVLTKKNMNFKDIWIGN